MPRVRVIAAAMSLASRDTRQRLRGVKGAGTVSIGVSCSVALSVVVRRASSALGREAC